MSNLEVSTKKGEVWYQKQLYKHILEYVGMIICYGSEEKFVIFIFRDSIRDRIFEEESTALYDMKSFQNPELVDQYFCWCCICWCCFLPKKIGRGLQPALYIADYLPKKTHVTRFLGKTNAHDVPPLKIETNYLWNRRQNLHTKEEKDD